MDEVSTLAKMHKLEHKAPEIRWGATFQKIIVVALFLVCPYVPGSKYTYSPLAGSIPGVILQLFQFLPAEAAS